jgi:hypothetical protein
LLEPERAKVPLPVLERRPVPPIAPLNVAVPAFAFTVLVPATVMAFATFTALASTRDVPPDIAKSPVPSPVLEVKEIAPAVRFVPPL